MKRDCVHGIALCLIAMCCAGPLFAIDCLTQHFNNQRTGENSSETILTPASVASGNFGKLFLVGTNEEPDGQVLYVANVSIAGGTHNVMYVRAGWNGGGSDSSIYAYDADAAVTYQGNPWYWKVQLVPNLGPWNTNAPVIDKANNAIYAVAQDSNAGGAQYLYALDLSTGANKPGSPVTIQVETWAGQPVANTIDGTGGGSVGGRLAFNPAQHNCRPALLLDNGTVWMAFSHNSDGGAYHGWVFGYNSTTLKQTHVFCNTRDGNGGGIWQTNAGLAADANNNVYFVGGNGTFDVNSGGRDYSMCFTKLHPVSPLNADLSTNVTVADWYANYNCVNWSNSDLDAGETGVILIPGTNKLVSGGTKYAQFHMLEYQNYTAPATTMGHFDASGSSDHQTNVQTMATGSGNWDNGQNCSCWDGPSGSYVYLWPPGIKIQSFLYDPVAGKLNPASQNVALTQGGYTCITSNAGNNAILWAHGDGGPPVLHALNPANLTQEYWNSAAKAADNIPQNGAWQFPMAVNGKVYVCLANGVEVFGMIGGAPVFTSVSVAPASATVIVNGTKSFTAMALDQNGNPMSPQPAFTWSVSGGGSINSSGLFTAGSAPSGPFTVTAQATIGAITKSGTASVTVNSNIKVTPPVETVAINTSYTFTATALDGSGNPVSPQPAFTWAVSGGGAINSGGVFTAGNATGGPFTITASTGGGSSGTTQVTVTASPYGIDTLGALGPYLNNKMPATIAGAIPATLSAAGAFSNTASMVPTAGLVPYNVNTPLWSDAALKQRWTALATGTTANFSPTGEFTWPNGTVFVKHFDLGTDDTNPAVTQRLETRILVRDSNGHVYGVTYQWRSDNSDADLVPAGGSNTVVTIKTAGGGTRTQTWYFPSQADCMTCHTLVSGGVLGVKSRQLNGNYTYSGSGITDNQLRTWNHLNLFTPALTEANIPTYPKLLPVAEIGGDSAATIQQRARSYLDSNCFGCHQPGGASNANWDARFDTALASQGLIDVNPVNTLGIPGAKVIASGSTAQSVLRLRVAAVPPDPITMPPISKHIVDAVALKTIDDWINGLLAINTASPLAAGDVGTAYSVTFAQSGGTAPYTWSLASGAFPGGLSLSGATLSGTPNAAGTFNFTIKVADSAGASNTKAFALTINAALAITTASPLGNGNVGTAYSQTLAASGGSGTLTWSISSGALPAGLSLSGAGVISGSPTTAGSPSFTVKVVDAANGSATKVFTLTVTSGLTITTASPLPSGDVGTAYSVTFMQAGGNGAVTWSLASGTFPGGLTLTGATLSGTPNAAGTFNFTIKVVDSGGNSATTAFALTINAALSITTASPLPVGDVGTAYSQTLAETGGSTPLAWSVSSGSLPGGLALSASGVLSGTPNAAGTFNFTIKLSDSAGASVTKSYALTINGALSITTPTPLPGGDVGKAYALTFALSGGSAAFTWSISSGNLPAGLSLSAAGSVSGTPTTAGTANFTVQVVDAAGATAAKSYSLTINAMPLVTTASPLPGGNVGAAYSVTFTAAGGTAPLAWAVTSGTPPTGLSLSAGGVLSGTPTTAGTSNFTVTVTDAAGSSANKAFAVTVASNLVLTSITVTPASATLAPSATQVFTGTALDQFKNPLVPQPGFIWSTTGGGAINSSGLFTAGIGAGTFTISATNGSVGGTAIVTVDPPPTVSSPPSVNPTTIVVNVPVTFTGAGNDPTGGTINYVWNFGDGTTGTGPSATHTYGSVGNFTVTLTMTNSIGGATTSTLNITVVSGAGASGGAGVTIAMTVSKLQGTAKFTGGGHDFCSISGVIPALPKLFDPSGLTMVLNINGATVAFKLDAHGRGKSANGSVSLKLKPSKRNPKTKKNEFQGGNVAFTAKIQNGTWSATWGLDPKANSKNVTMMMPATILLGGNTYVATVTTMYSDKAGVSGKFKK